MRHNLLDFILGKDKYLVFEFKPSKTRKKCTTIPIKQGIKK